MVWIQVSREGSEKLEVRSVISAPGLLRQKSHKSGLHGETLSQNKSQCGSIHVQVTSWQKQQTEVSKQKENDGNEECTS